MDMTTDSTMSMSSMVFDSSTTTPLYSTGWVPSSTGGYAGTCIFIIILAIASRSLGAWRAVIEQRWHDQAANRRYVVVADRDGGVEDRLGQEVETKGEGGVLTTRGLEQNVKIIETNARCREGRPWRLSVDLPRALIFTVQAGFGYLLMLAVMTMNVGYFLSVLGGLFLGELVVGRYAPHSTSSHP